MQCELLKCKNTPFPLHFGWMDEWTSAVNNHLYSVETNVCKCIQSTKNKQVKFWKFPPSSGWAPAAAHDKHAVVFSNRCMQEYDPNKTSPTTPSPYTLRYDHVYMEDNKANVFKVVRLLPFARRGLTWSLPWPPGLKAAAVRVERWSGNSRSGNINAGRLSESFTYTTVIWKDRGITGFNPFSAHREPLQYPESALGVSRVCRATAPPSGN